jgi:Tfp pilus assembly protein PilV
MIAFQAPVAVVPQTFMQQIMPTLVVFVIGLLGALGLVIRAYVNKLVAQLQVNHATSLEAAANAKSAAADAKTAADDVKEHAQQASEKLNSIEGKVNGAMTALQQKSDAADATILAAKDAQIETLKQQLPKQV